MKKSLEARAQREGKTVEEIVRDILRAAVMKDEVLAGGLGTEIAAMFKTIGLKSRIRELRGRRIKPADL